MILSQLRMGARQTKNAPLDSRWETTSNMCNDFTHCATIFSCLFYLFLSSTKKIFFFTLLPRFFQHIMARHRYFRAFCLFVFPSFYLSILVFVHLCWPTLILDHLRQFSKFSLAVESAIFYLYQITSDSIARLNFDNCVRIYERYTAKGDFFSSK